MATIGEFSLHTQSSKGEKVITNKEEDEICHDVDGASPPAQTIPKLYPRRKKKSALDFIPIEDFRRRRPHYIRAQIRQRVQYRRELFDERMRHYPGSGSFVENKNKQKEDTSKTGGDKDSLSPICCIMGHIYAGKTKLLDCIRGVEEVEAAGITQQTSATYITAEKIQEITKELKEDAKVYVPGLFVIDTPGHESFTYLRSIGLCDFAILVVDIMHGLEPQTIESLNLLKMTNTEFIVALNMVDGLYGWKPCCTAPFLKAIKQQSNDVQLEFNTRLTKVITEFKEQGLNAELYYKDKEMVEILSIVPTSAISGVGIPDLLSLLLQRAQKTIIEKPTYGNEVQRKRK